MVEKPGVWKYGSGAAERRKVQTLESLCIGGK